MMGFRDEDSDCPEFAEVDPTGRYGRYNEILGKGASKTVYRAFDEYEGLEVAWNQVKLHDFLQSPEDLERLYCEIHLLRTLKHKNIMKFFTSWVDTSKGNINFITEMFTSGTLRQYRQKHRRVNIRAVKHWCRQILMGLLYLHSHEPPIIHRDLKCDNIFINGNQGEVKIGDLGLAAILQKSHAAHCVGTPEFMAPEVYEEEYNELVDIYSFGMCVLEMVTFEYPYSECTHPAEIYKKVISGMKPEALSGVKDPVVRQFVDKCLATVSRRLSARELLKDPFLQIDGHGSCSWEGDIIEMGYIPTPPSHNPLCSCGSLITNGFSDDLYHETETENGWDYNVADLGMHGFDFFNGQEDEHLANLDITIRGRRGKDGIIFLRLRIADKEGHIRNIYFHFYTESDSALSVATEMVAELDMTDYDVTRIAEMIDCEVSSLVPEWKPGPGIEELPGFPTADLCRNCTSHVSSSGSLLDLLSSDNHSCTNLQTAYYSLLESGATHGRFEEITYQVEGSEHSVTEEAPVLSTSQSEALDLSSQESRGSQESHSCEEVGQLNQPAYDGVIVPMSSKSLGQICSKSSHRQCSDISDLGYHSPPNNIPEDHENKICRQLQSLEATNQTELLDHGDNQLGTRKGLNPVENREGNVEHGVTASSGFPLLRTSNKTKLKSFHLGRNYSFCIPQDDTNPIPTDESSETMYGCGWSAHPGLASRREDQHCAANAECSPENLITAKRFYSGITVSGSLPRTKSLQVGAVDA